MTIAALTTLPTAQVVSGSSDPIKSTTSVARLVEPLSVQPKTIDPVAVALQKDPALGARMVKTRESLLRAAREDKLKLCVGDMGFSPYGYEVECARRQYVHEGGPFRQGVVYSFQADMGSGDYDLSLRAVDGIARLLVHDIKVPYEEALANISKDFTRAYGMSPLDFKAKRVAEATQTMVAKPVSTTTSEPTRTIKSAQATITPTAPASISTVPAIPIPLPKTTRPVPTTTQPLFSQQITPMPRPTGPDPFQTQQGGQTVVPPCGPGGCGPTPTPTPTPPPAPTPASESGITVGGKTVPTWALGLGGVALLGGIGFALYSRKKGGRR